MFVYSVGIIDWWNGWQKPEQVFGFNDDCGIDISDKRGWDRWNKLLGEACAKARDLGWEGDMREGPFVTVLPHSTSSDTLSPVAIGWKQDNNGSTFIASEVPLPWFEA